MKKYTLISLLFGAMFSCYAQVDSTVIKKDSTTIKEDATVMKEDSAVTAAVHTPKSYFLASVSYLSNSIYNGRKDSIATPYITPMIGYYDKSGFFINGSLSYLARSGSSRIDLFSVGAGYDFSFGNFDGELAASKSFYSSSSTNVQSEIKGSVFASGDYDFNFIDAHIEGGINFGSKPDYLLDFGLEHTFYAAADKLRLTPSFIANASTQNYYGSYYSNRRYGGKRKKAAGITYEVFADVKDASTFKVLNYEFSLPISYVVNKFTFNFIPAYAIPVNPATVTVLLTPSSGPTPAPKIFTEKLDNSFYFSFGISYKLKVKAAKQLHKNL
jgi:hypothetical protein